MSRIEEIKKHGYSVRLFDHNGKTEKEFSAVRFYIICDSIMTLYGLELNIIADIRLNDYSGYNLITKAV